MRYVAFFLGTLFYAGSLFGAMHQLHMDDAISLALKHSPDINQSMLDIERSKERNRFEKGNYLPNLNLMVVGGKSNLNVSGRDLDGSGVAGTINAFQLLYDFGKTGGKIDASKLDIKADEARLKQTVAKKILDVKVRYYNLLKAKSIIDVNKKDIELQKEQLRRAKRYFESGIRTLIDVTDAKVRLTRAKLSLNNARYDLKLKQALFEQSLGMTPYGGDYELTYKENDWFEKDVENALPSLDESLDELTKFAYMHRHELFAINYKIAALKENIKSAQGEYYPSLYFKADYSKIETNENDPSLHLDDVWDAGIVLEWNLFKGFRSEATVEKSKIEHLQTQSKLEQLRLRIKREVVQSYLEVKRSKDAIALSKEVANASLQKFEQAQKRYEHGLSDYIELQDARHGYIRSLNDLVVAYYDYFIALANLDYAIGR